MKTAQMSLPLPAAAPHLGEHSRTILQELGCDAARIDAVLR